MIERTNLQNLGENKYLTNKIFKNLSENCHYEVFKFLDEYELLELRMLNTGGFQLSSNQHIRGKRVQNYFEKFSLMFSEEINLLKYINYIEMMFVQIGGRYLGISEIYECESGIIQIVEIFKLFNNIHELNLGFNSIGNMELEKQNMLFKAIPKLLNLNLEGNGFQGNKIEVIMENLMQQQELKVLNLGSNGIGEYGIEILIKCLPHISNLNTLILDSNGLGNEGITKFSKELHHLPNLKHLSLRNNRIGAGFSVLGSALEHNTPHLENLDLGDNNMNQEGGKLFEGFRRLNKLKRLNLWCTSCNEEVGILYELTEKFRYIEQLTSINLGYNGIKMEGAKFIAKSFSYLPLLRTLDLRDNLIKNEGAVMIGQNLHKIPYLEELNMVYNGICDDGVLAFAIFLNHSSRLVLLNLAGNHITLKVQTQMRENTQIYDKLHIKF